MKICILTDINIYSEQFQLVPNGGALAISILLFFFRRRAGWANTTRAVESSASGHGGMGGCGSLGGGKELRGGQGVDA